MKTDFWFDIVSDRSYIDKVVIRGADYYKMPHKTEYKIKLGNDTEARVDAHVYVDGKKIGVWRVRPYSTTTIERASYSNRKLTFLKTGSESARSVGIKKNLETNGLIKVVFKPEKVYEVFYDHIMSPKGRGYLLCNDQQSFNLNSSFENSFEGATALGKRSDQEFNRTSALTDIDTDNIVVLYARLMISDNGSEFEPLRKTNVYPKKIDNTFFGPYFYNI